MTKLLQLMSGGVARRPRVILAVLAILTVVLGGFAANQSTDTELTAFAPNSELAATFDRVQEEFSAGGAQIQVMVDAGSGGDVLSSDGIAAAEAVARIARDADVELAEGQRAVRSFAAPITAILDSGGLDPAAVSEDQISTLAKGVLSAEETAAVAGLLSGDLDIDAGSARAGLVVVELDPALDQGDADRAALALADRLDAQIDVEGIEVRPFSNAILNDQLEAQSSEELPMLLSMSLLLIVVILFFQYRKVSDVLLAFVGLIVTIMWMFGIGVLLGPDHLGIVGPFTQISTIIPVLLVGLGVDYAIHLTSRYREELGYGAGPPAAAAMAVRTVGGALILATLTTVVGFLTNLFSPLPPIADFGVFTAVGVISAFIVMALLVPAARSSLDSRPRARRRARERAATSDRPEHSGEVRGLAALMSRTSTIAERAPKLTLGIAAVLTLAAVGVGTQIESSFSQEDFVPEDSEPGGLIADFESLFGGDLAETTYVLVDGDLADRDVIDAVVATREALGSLDGVRTGGGRAEVDSPLSLLSALAGRDQRFAQQAAGFGFTPDEGLADDADLAALYELARSAAPDRTAQVLTEESDAAVLAVATTAGQEGATELRDGIYEAAEPLRDVGATTTVVSEPLVFDETLDALTDSQTRGIVITLVAALLLLVVYFWVVQGKPVLGAITMVPSVAVVGWTLGTMVLLDISFNVLTAMVASLAIGIGVPYGIHVTHRFLEDRRRYDTIDEALSQTVTHTGGAMAGSALTTAAGFGVLIFASLVPMQQFGIIVAITILYSLAAAVLIQPSCLKLWGEWRHRRGDFAELHEHEQRDAQPVG